ncbi:MAG: hypothetical protein ACRDRU_02415 [Pseudonocardiaceae bacterium]
MAERLWSGLDPAVANGQACVVCGRSLRFRRSGWLPVGHTPTGMPVFACVGSCAQHVATTPAVVPIPDDALTAGGITLLAVLDRTGGNPNRANLNDLVEETVRAATAIVVAAELRRIITELRTRADELDPAGSKQ